MRKQNQHQHQAQVQQQNQGGTDMKPTQQPSVYFVTFTTKLDPEKTREVLSELRRRFPLQTPIFTPRPPAGKRIILTINDVLTILTIPKSPNRQEEQASRQGGFTVAELIKNKP